MLVLACTLENYQSHTQGTFRNENTFVPKSTLGTRLENYMTLLPISKPSIYKTFYFYESLVEAVGIQSNYYNTLPCR